MAKERRLTSQGRGEGGVGLTEGRAYAQQVLSHRRVTPEGGAASISNRLSEGKPCSRLEHDS